MTDDASQDRAPEVALRIPGDWAGPEQFADALPDGHRMEDDRLMMPDGSSVEIAALPADEEFAALFRQSCSREPSPEELTGVDGYSVKIGRAHD